MITRLVVAAWTFALLAAPAPQAPRKGLPPVPSKQLPASSTKLSLWIGGGIFPPNYVVTLEGDALTYRVKSSDPKTNKPIESTRTIRPSPEQWREFWKSMDEVGLWRWRPTYENRQVLDGTHWGVEAAHDGRSNRSSGHMSFPGRTPAGVAKDPSEHGPLFDKYLAAVRKLLGGEPFR
jgi:hypothetical protein